MIDDPIRDFTADLAAVTNDDIDRLRAQLARDAAEGGLVDVAYRTVGSPIGDLLLAATPAGLVRVAFENEDHDQVLQTLSDRLSPRVLRVPSRLDRAARQLDEYFAGTRKTFDLDVDLVLTSRFRRAVLTYLPTIGYGHTASYATVAAKLDNPRAVRAVGTACATNPVPLVIPCHRVVRSDGQTGSYRGGPEAKATLLRLEAAAK